MSPKQFFVRKVAILGAGVMGAQIAALFANAKIESLLFDQAAKEGDPNALVKQAILALKMHHPSPLAVHTLIDNIQAANYEHDLILLKECDLVIETISERMDWKSDLLKKVAPYLSEDAFLLCNTCGLSIEKLSSVLPIEIQPRFAGIQFFKPPRFMPLVEVIPHASTNGKLLEHLETFLVKTMGKVVVFAKDSPNFICHRIGLFSVLSAEHHAEQFGLTPDTVDLLTGTLIGRPKSATFRALDSLGLDTFAQGLSTLTEGIVKEQDPWYPLYKMPAWMSALIQKGALGKKTKAGIYRKIKEEIQVIDKQGNYRPIHQKLNPEIPAIFKYVSLHSRLAKLRESNLPEGKFLWALFRDLFHYIAFHLSSIAETTRDVDLALRYGYGWERGPFEIWQEAGWKTVLNWIEEDIRAKRSLCGAPLPTWVHDLNEIGVYREGTAYSPERGIYIGRSKLPVYERQIYPDLLLGEPFEEGKTIFETDDLRMWCLNNDNVGIVSFKTKHNMINEGVLTGIQEAIARSENDHQALILWQAGSKDFSFGANLKFILDLAKRHQIQDLTKLIKLFQQTALALRYSKVPTLAAIQGLVLGNACELMMHCTHTIAALESYPGLTEVSLGLIPMGGGCKEMAMKASIEARGEDPFPVINTYFNTLSNAVKAQSAEDAKRLGFLKTSDVVVMNPKEVLYVAKQIARSSSESNYRPPMKPKITVAGKSGWASLQVALIRMCKQEQIKDHDFLVLSGLAKVLCGGEIGGGLQVTEEWLLELERQFFIEFIQTKKTEERIQYMLEQGQSLQESGKKRFETREAIQ